MTLILRKACKVTLIYRGALKLVKLLPPSCVAARTKVCQLHLRGEGGGEVGGGGGGGGGGGHNKE